MVERPLDWSERLLYLSVVMATLMVCAAFVYLLCYISSFGGGGADDDDGENDNGPTIGKRLRRHRQATHRPARMRREEGLAEGPDATLVAIVSSAIPMGQLVEGNDVVVNVGQQLCINRDNQFEGRQRDQHPANQRPRSNTDDNDSNSKGPSGAGPGWMDCVVCGTRKITWIQAQTTINILLCKRTAQGPD